MCLCFFLLTTTAASAHPVPFSYLDVHVRPATLDVTLVVHVFDAGHDLDIGPAERLLDPTTLRGYASALQTMLAPRLTVAADCHTLTPDWQGVEPIAERSSLRLRLTYALPPVPPPRLVPILRRDAPGHGRGRRADAARRYSSHPDRAGSHPVPDLPAAHRRQRTPTRPDRHRLHHRPQPDALARGAEPCVAAGAS